MTAANQNSESKTMFSPSTVRKDFPIFERKIHGKPLIYLDNAATSQRPKQVLDKLYSYYIEQNANVHRGVHTLSHESSIEYDKAHKKVAKFINAPDWREVIFTRNATEAINIVVHGWALWNLKPGDEVVTTIMEHHSGIVPWLMLKERNQVMIKYVDVDDNGRLNINDLKRAITPKTKIVNCIYASNVLGTVNPIAEVIHLAKEVGAITIIDAAQATPHMPVDVQALDCDFLAASGHKMMGPSGSGFLYGKTEILDSMQPFMYGGDMISKVTTESATWNELPWKFEAGTPSIADGIAFGAAIDYLSELGMENVYEHEQQLLAYALERMLKMRGITIYGPYDLEDRVGVISFGVDGLHPHDVAGVLDEEGIAVRSGHHCAQPLMTRMGMDNTARASFYVYNTEDEVDSLIAAIEKAQARFKV